MLPIEDLDATYLVEDFGTATKAIEYIMRTGNAFEKLLAQRIKPFLKGVKLVIVNNPEKDITNAQASSGSLVVQLVCMQRRLRARRLFT
jgi:hypothetical protein